MIYIIIEINDINDIPVNKIIHGDALKAIKRLPSNSIDAVVTDPPYGIEFLEQNWDKKVPNVIFWREVYRVVKLGAHIISFFGTRTYHNGVYFIEKAGFEIRDMLLWLYGCGFPKGVDMRRYGYEGLHTTLKPACEPAVIARKPLEGSILNNFKKWGTGCINIDKCRIDVKGQETGRFPTNVIIDKCVAKEIDKQSGKYKSSKSVRDKYSSNWVFDWGGKSSNYTDSNTYGDYGGASRFFYCAKAGRDERYAYCINCNKVIPSYEWNKHKKHKLIYHTTVKPLKLIEWLVRLVTPENGIVLDPFIGSGTTAAACLKNGYKFIGVEIDKYYCKIAEHRIKPYLSQKTL